MSYSDEERLPPIAKEGLDIPATIPRVCDVQRLMERRECGLDNTLSETFPCSDPLSSIPDPTAI
jgi:hypothetical protein